MITITSSIFSPKLNVFMKQITKLSQVWKSPWSLMHWSSPSIFSPEFFKMVWHKLFAIHFHTMVLTKRLLTWHWNLQHWFSSHRRQDLPSLRSFTKFVIVFVLYFLSFIVLLFITFCLSENEMFLFITFSLFDCIWSLLSVYLSVFVHYFLFIWARKCLVLFITSVFFSKEGFCSFFQSVWLRLFITLCLFDCFCSLLSVYLSTEMSGFVT